MKKKVIAITLAILLSSVSIASIALAGQESEKTRIIPPYIRPRYPEVSVAQGVALSKTTLETEPVVFLMIKYKGSIQTYLIIDDDLYKLSKAYERYDWETGTKIFQYEANDGSTLTLIIQRYYSRGIVSISGDFKDFLINFEPIYKYPRPIPIKEVRPLKNVAKELKKESGINIEDVLRIPSKPIAEWSI